jgi:4-hydroxyphenylacetate 3-monooxygenase
MFKTPSHSYGNHQAQVRYVTKLRFMIGLAQRTVEMIGSAGSPPVQISMGELAALVSIYEGLLLAHEASAPIKDGILWPSVVTLYSAMAMQSEFNGRMLEMIRELVSSSVISQPSSAADFENPEIAPMIERYMRSGSMDAKSRTALVRLLWDFFGTEFGSRQAQYEKFYGGSSSIVKQNVYRNFDFKRATGLVDKALNLPAVRST